MSRNNDCPCLGRGYYAAGGINKPYSQTRRKACYCEAGKEWNVYRKLSPAQLATLDGITHSKDPYHACRGRSEFGGRWQVIRSLQNRGLISGKFTGPNVWQLTQKGRKVYAHSFKE